MVDPFVEGTFPMDIRTMGISFGLGKQYRMDFKVSAQGYGDRKEFVYFSRGWEILYLLNHEWAKVLDQDGNEFEVLERDTAWIVPFGARYSLEATIKYGFYMRASFGLYPGYELDPVGSFDFGWTFGMGW